MFTFKGMLLEINSGEYMGFPYTKVKIRSEDVGEKKILAYSVDTKKCKVSEDLLDTEVEVTFELMRGKGEAVVAKVVGLEEV